jgi:conjugal transfer pilus assembly protein TrbC
MSHAQSGPLQDAFRQGARDQSAPWQLTVFVSLRMPQASLVSLAREAGRGGARLVLMGSEGEEFDLSATQRQVREINRLCCDKRPQPVWQIDPPQFARYGIRAVPAFVLSKGQSVTDFTKITGDMPLSAALQSMAQQSREPGASDAAKALYAKVFATR